MRLVFVLLIVSLWDGSSGQSSWASWTNENKPPDTTQGRVFYMDSTTDCNKEFRIEDSRMLRSKGSGMTLNVPLTCHITLSAEDTRKQLKFAIEVEQAAIGNAGVNFYIYDGKSGSNRVIKSFSGGTAAKNVPTLYSTGQDVTFVLTRKTAEMLDYTIDIKVTPMPADLDTVRECEGGEGPGCVYFYNELPVTKEVIIGIVGGIFGLIVVIIIPIIVICCYRKQRGVTRRWDEFKLGQGNTAATIAGSSVNVKPKNEPWTSASSKYPHSVSKSKMSVTSEDDSVFDEVPKSYPPPPPPYSRYDQQSGKKRDQADNKFGSRDKLERRGRRSSGDDRDWYDSRDLLDKRDRDRLDSRDRLDRRDRDRYDSRERLDRRDGDRYDSRERLERRDRDRYDSRERLERRERDRYDSRERLERERNVRSDRDRSSRKQFYDNRSRKSGSESDNSFVQAEDDHPQENFVERIITPRVKTKSKQKPDEDVYDTLDESASELEKSDQGVQCGQSDDDESNTETTDDASTETESEEEKPDPKSALYAKPNKKGKTQAPPQNVPQPQVAPYPYPPQVMPQAYPRGVVPPQMMGGVPQRPQAMGMYPPPGVVVRPVNPQVQQPYFAPGAYPQPHPAVRPMGTLPQQPNQNMFRPVQNVPPQNKPQSRPSQPSMANDPPVYSYLVQRGYTPLEAGRQSPNSLSTGGASDGFHTEDSEVGPNIQSGVDLMRRNTTTTV